MGLLWRLLLINAVLALAACPAYKVCIGGEPISASKNVTTYEEGQQNGK